MLTWLRSAQETFDIVLLDPPSFSNSRAVTDSFDVQRDHVELIEAAMVGAVFEMQVSKSSPRETRKKSYPHRLPRVALL